jgi:hypothetical protein
MGLDRIETASFLRSNGTFQYLTGLPGFPDPQTLRRFLLNAPPSVWEHLHRVNDQLLQKFIHLPDRRSRGNPSHPTAGRRHPRQDRCPHPLDGSGK